ncbi:MAG: sugar phosphate isomerase/epimerase [Verrucomicrobiales bacterium]|nr:sugar phosphate isomerase/epimerase [Verrucomicrobiales bacterium]
MQTLTRREFLDRTVRTAVVAGTAWGISPARAQGATENAPRQPIYLGGPVFNLPPDPEAAARAHRDLGYAAAYCPNVSLNDPAAIRATREAYERVGVVIAEVGRWVNLLDRDPEKRAAHLKLVTEGLALADEIGARCCVDIAGSFNETVWYGPHPDNLSERFFDAAVENARKIVDAVKPKRAKFCYEMMGWALPDSPDSCRDLLRAVDRAGFGVHLDPCNLINSPTRFYRNTTLLDECFDKLGPWIASCHAKDLAWNIEMNVHFREVVPGQGELDYATFLRRLARLPQAPPLMLEHLSSAAEYDQGRRHIKQVGEQAGLVFA